jgi:cytochrome c5
LIGWLRKNLAVFSSGRPKVTFGRPFTSPVGLLTFLFGCLVSLAASLSAIQTASAATPTPQTPMDFMARFPPPPTVYPPTQADQGAQLYYYICMVCHGDQGQGLEQWRKQLEPQDQNCWQSKCHAPNHMVFGFTFPQDVPALRNRGMLLTFQNAYDLYVFIKKYMPYQSPGSLKDDEYWQLTAFLMKLNGLDPGPQPLNAERAAGISLVPSTPVSMPSEKSDTNALEIFLAGLLLLILVGIVFVIQMKARSQPR